MSGHTALGHLRKVTAAAVVATAATFGLIACQDNAEANAPSPSTAAPTDSGDGAGHPEVELVQLAVRVEPGLFFFVSSSMSLPLTNI